MNTKTKFRMEIKGITAEGTFEGILSPYGNVDGGGDVVEPGAYTKTIKEHAGEVPMLWQHHSDEPIGMLALEDTPAGLMVKGSLLMELPEATKAYLLIKAGIVKGLSIGFETIKKTLKDGVRHLQEIKLYEGSIVTFPMNEMALITSVKTNGETKDDFNEELAEIQILDARCQLQAALSSALSSVIWSGLARDEAITAVDVILQQFVEAYTAFLPTFLDTLTEMYGEMETWAAKEPEIKARLQKSGAMISAANKKSIQGFIDQIKSAHEGLSALIAEEAGSSTSKEEAAVVEQKSEPVVDHSVVETFIENVRSLISA